MVQHLQRDDSVDDCHANTDTNGTHLLRVVGDGGVPEVTSQKDEG